ncbi:hypothetical protein J4442_02630 [Candidatus Woesearchaeota archaeon]|nr:hypothetical protein [Candidatus Woesearchaeota archaeon]
MYKRGLLFLLVFIIFLQSSLAQDSCLAVSQNPSEEQLNQLITESATRIWNVYSQIPKYSGNNNEIFKAALIGLENWEPEPKYAILANYKERIADELRILAGVSGSCIDNYSLNAKDGYLNGVKLNTNEYVISGEVIDIYNEVTGHQTTRIYGMYTPEQSPFLVDFYKGPFIEGLMSRTDFSSSQSDCFYTLFSTEGNVILRDDTPESIFSHVIFHERVHYQISLLDSTSQRILEEAKEIFIEWMINQKEEVLGVNAETKETTALTRSFFEKNIPNGQLRFDIQHGSWTEFYAGLGAWTEHPKPIEGFDALRISYQFKIRHPEAEVIWKQVFNSVREGWVEKRECIDIYYLDNGYDCRDESALCIEGGCVEENSAISHLENILLDPNQSEELKKNAVIALVNLGELQILRDVFDYQNSDSIRRLIGRFTQRTDK